MVDAALANVVEVDVRELHPRAKEVEFIVACDVANPLLGKQGASHVFGPQKGASPELVETLESALSCFSSACSKSTGVDHSDTAGFGAAGGTPLGLSLVFDIQIKQGIEMVLDTLNADKVLENADLVITGEGQMDNQTLQGKTPFGIAKTCATQKLFRLSVLLVHSVMRLMSSMATHQQHLWHSPFAAIFRTSSYQKRVKILLVLPVILQPRSSLAARFLMRSNYVSI